MGVAHDDLGKLLSADVLAHGHAMGKLRPLCGFSLNVPPCLVFFALSSNFATVSEFWFGALSLDLLLSIRNPFVNLRHNVYKFAVASTLLGFLGVAILLGRKKYARSAFRVCFVGQVVFRC